MKQRLTVAELAMAAESIEYMSAKLANRVLDLRAKGCTLPGFLIDAALRSTGDLADRSPPCDHLAERAPLHARTPNTPISTQHAPTAEGESSSAYSGCASQPRTRLSDAELPSKTG